MPDLNQIQQLDLNLLKVFESLYLQQNMTRTAEQLHITPSAVSHAVKRLRVHLADPLFERSQHKMLPTPVCQRMAPLIIDTLSRLRQILQQWGEFDPQTSQQHFRLGIHDALEPSILPGVARHLFEHAPGTTFASIKVERSQLSRALGSGQVDVVLDVAMPMKLPIRHQPVFDDSFCILLNKHHPQANCLHQQTYFNAQHISVSHRPTGAALEDLLLQQQGMARDIAVRCQNYYAAKEILKQRPYLLTLPKALAHRLLDDSLQVVRLPFSMPGIVTHLYWHQNTQQDHALSWFREKLNQWIGQLSFSQPELKLD